MEEQLQAKVLGWFRQYVRDVDDHVEPNVFLAQSESDIEEFVREFGEVLPSSYLTFLREIGAGRIRRDIDGRETFDYENYFMSTAEIAEILRKETVDWKIYPDFIDDGEIPFFSLGNNSVLVFRVGSGSAVFYPYLDRVYANSFWEFLDKLMHKVTFYRRGFDE